MEQEPRSIHQLQARPVGMSLHFDRWIGDVGQNRVIVLNQPTVEHSPCASSTVKDSILAHQLDTVARGVSLPALLVPGQPGRWDDDSAGRRSNDRRARA